jgi:hypothetical protein
MSPATETAEFLLARLSALRGSRVKQAPRRDPLECSSRAPALRFFSEHHVAGVREPEARALAAWSTRDEMAELRRAAAATREIVRLQAEGRRCVALIEDAPPAEGVAFALHDLRHLYKFFEPEHHAAQRGFFACVARALESSAWAELDAVLDEIWVRDRDAVLADMNGSPVFLFSALKMKLKVAARRRYARFPARLAALACSGPRDGSFAAATLRFRGPQAPDRGALDPDELATFEPLLDRCLDGLGLNGDVRVAARAISCRRDAAPHARAFVEYFAALAPRPGNREVVS